MFPEIVAQRGGLKRAAVSHDGEMVLLKSNSDNEHVTLLSRGKKKKVTIRLRYESGLFPGAGTTNAQLNGFALASHEGRTLIIATWAEDFADGPGIGAFDLDGAPVFVDFILSKEAREARASATTRSAGSRSFQGALLSPDGTRVLVAIYDQKDGDELAVCTVASLASGKPELVTCKARERDFAFDSTSERFGHLTFSSDDTTIHTCDVKTGAKSSIRIANTGLLPRSLFGCGVWVIGHGAMFDDEGKPSGKFPGEIKCAARVGQSIAAVASNGAELWLANAATHDVEATIPVAKLGSTVASGGGVLVVAADRAARIFTMG